MSTLIVYVGLLEAMLHHLQYVPRIRFVYGIKHTEPLDVQQQKMVEI